MLKKKTNLIVIDEDYLGFEILEAEEEASSKKKYTENR